MSRREVVAEIAGTVHTVECSLGQSVESEATLIVLESMKMEIPVTAPERGTIASVLVAAGDVVEEGQVLVVIDS